MHSTSIYIIPTRKLGISPWEKKLIPDLENMSVKKKELYNLIKTYQRKEGLNADILAGRKKKKKNISSKQTSKLILYFGNVCIQNVHNNWDIHR